MAKSKGGGENTRQHYQYALTGNVPGVGNMGGASLPKGMQHAKGGRARKPHGRGR